MHSFTVDCKHSLRGALVSYVYTPVTEDEGCVNDVITFFDEMHDTLRTDIVNELTRLLTIKWHITVKARFVKYIVNADTDEEEEVTTQGYFHGRCHTTLIGDQDELPDRLEASYEKIIESIYKFTREGSGWALDHIVFLELVLSRYQPLAASSFIRTPLELSRTNAIINVNNKGDQMCFVWSVLAALFPQHSHSDRVSKYRSHFHSIITSGITYPAQLCDIVKFERDNSEVSINVFGYEEKEIYPLRITPSRGRRHHVNLLLLTTDDRKHYCLIKNMSRLLSSLTKHKARSFYCDYCLHRFCEERLLTEHVPHCSPYGEQRIRLPTKEKEKVMCFKNYTYCHKVPFAIYADFESFIVPCHRCDAPPHTSSTTTESLHLPSGFSYLIVDHERNIFKPQVVYRGENVIETFLDRLIVEERELYRICLLYTSRCV